MRAINCVLIAAAALLSSAVSWADEASDSLYRSQGFTTGTRDETRPAGFAHCMQDVLIKVSGDARLIGDPRLTRFEANAAKLITEFHYHDRMSGMPLHDEQGTRDRPYDLFCTFDHAGVDATLKSLGLSPWLPPRPRLVMFLGVRTATGDYLLASDGERGIDQRESLASGSKRRGVEVLLPTKAQLAELHVTFPGLAAAGPPRPDEAAKAVDGDLALSGTLVWSDAAQGWIVQWRFTWNGRIYRWRRSGVSYDEAFRQGIEGVALVLSGHGRPTYSIPAKSG